MENPSMVAAVSKLAIAGGRAGLSVEQMIKLLNGGLTVEALLHLISQCLEVDGIKGTDLAEKDPTVPWVM